MDDEIDRNDIAIAPTINVGRTAPRNSCDSFDFASTTVGAL
jgi:hypothetical protein